jgi:hypothetical protein
MSNSANSTNHNLIGLCGRKGSGKSTVSKYIVSKYGFQNRALADPLKDIAKIFGFTDIELYGTQKDKMTINSRLGISSREFLTKFGTELCRLQFSTQFPTMNLGKSGIIWIKLFEDYISNCNHDVVCDDIRFLDEVNMIQTFGGKVIKIVRPTNGGTKTGGDHISESSVDDIDTTDFIIINDGSLGDLYKKIDNILDNVLK